ncbi:MAG: hypothetical protein U5R31_04965 [Acidimicrobiia bacterium]|nr:hypothetical protein [Acidimicrobiia bacterium]
MVDGAAAEAVAGHGELVDGVGTGVGLQRLEGRGWAPPVAAREHDRRHQSQRGDDRRGSVAGSATGSG